MGLSGLTPNQPHKPKEGGTQSKTTPRATHKSLQSPHDSELRAANGGTLSEKKAGRQENVGSSAAAADASSGSGNTETPQEFDLNVGLTQARGTQGLQQNKGMKTYPLTALICFPSVHCSSQSASPPLALLHTNFQQITFPPVAVEV